MTIALVKQSEETQSAWDEIKDADQDVKKLMSEINAAAKWIAIGARLNAMHDTLDRINQHDKTSPGWRQAFTDGRFGMTFMTGSKFATIGQVLSAVSESETAKLPTTWGALYHLASGFKKRPEKLTLAIREGKVTPMMTEREAKALAGKKSRKEHESKSANATPMQRLEEKREEYTKATKLLTKQERQQEVEAIAKELKVAASTTAPTVTRASKKKAVDSQAVKDAVEQLAAVTKELSFKQRTDILVDCCHALHVAVSTVMDRDYALSKARGEVEELHIPMPGKGSK